MAIRRLLARWIRIGRRPEMRPSEARYVVLANIIALVGVLFTLGFVPFLAFTGWWMYPVLQILYATGYLPVLWLNHRGRRLAATTWLLLGSHLLAVLQVLVEASGSTSSCSSCCTRSCRSSWSRRGTARG